MKIVDVNLLSPASRGLLEAVAAVAAELGLPVYLVGGPVRDLLLGKQPTDLDIAVEMDAIRLAKGLQARFGGELQLHTRFGTAKWLLTTAVWEAIDSTLADSAIKDVDFATTRTETYAHPAALPDVAFAPIAEDLKRRDFTINALALRLDGPEQERLVDLYGGQQDLAAGVVRVLHDQSFFDDPTRSWRAVRFARRFGFQLETETANWLQQALPHMEQVSGERLTYEIRLVLQESEPASILAQLDKQGILRAVDEGLVWLAETAVSFNRLPHLVKSEPWLSHLPAETAVFARLALWLTSLPVGTQTAVMTRLRLPKRDQVDITAVHALKHAISTLDDAMQPSEIEQALRGIPLRVLLTVQADLAAEHWFAERLAAYVGVWRWVKTAVTGDDLRTLGLPPGPRYREILNEVLAEKINGRLPTEADERAYLEGLVAKG
ncbi:MAG: hypothetical protein AAF614_15990 [Chloroflexota bacterium]